MEKIIKIGDRPIKFKSTGATLLRYKLQFQRDMLTDLLMLEKAINKKDETNINSIDLEMFYNLLWTFAKTADKTIEPPLEWLDSFEEFPIFDIIPELQDLIFSNFKTITNSKN